MILLDTTTAADLTTTAATWAFTTTSDLTTEYFTTEYTTTAEGDSTGWPFPFIKLLIGIPLAILAIVVGGLVLILACILAVVIVVALIQLTAAVLALFGITCATTITISALKAKLCCCFKQTIQNQVEASSLRNIPLENATATAEVVEDNSNNQTNAVYLESEPGEKYKTDANY